MDTIYRTHVSGYVMYSKVRRGGCITWCKLTVIERNSVGPCLLTSLFYQTAANTTTPFLPIYNVVMFSGMKFNKIWNTFCISVC
jgi:hypothetical protein